jgi:thioredoxin-like negative regulator of GroEL
MRFYFMRIRLTRQSCFLASVLLFYCITNLLSVFPSSEIAVFDSLLPAIGLASSSSEPADEDGTIAFTNAQNAINNNDYSSALAYIQQAVAVNPANLDYQYLLGISYFKLSKLDEALSILFALVHEDSTAFQKVFFDLSAIYLQKNDEQNALKMLEQAYSLDPGRAEYEMGSINLKQKKFDKASENFERAALNKPELKADAATMQAVALLQLNQTSEAKRLLLNVLEMDFTPDKIAAVQQLIDSINEAEKADKPWQLTATLGFQYDSNVYQNPLENVGLNSVPGGVRNNEDGLSIFSLTGRYRFLKKDSWSFWGAYNHYQTNYIHNTELNLVGSRPSLQFQWDKSPFHAGLEYAYSHYWVYGESKVGVHSLLPRFLMDHPGNWQTNVSGAAEWKIYENSSPNDRHYRVSLMEVKMFPERKSHIRMQYTADFDEIGTAGRANMTGHEILAGIQYPLCFENWFADISGRYNWLFFQYDPQISMSGNRTDEQKSVAFMIFGKLYSGLHLNLVAQQIWNDSNITNQSYSDPSYFDPYEYKKALVSCYLTYNF